MDYMTIAQTASQWGVSERWVYKYLSDGRVEGATRFGSTWMVPAGAEKPPDPRKAILPPMENLTDRFVELLNATTEPMPSEDPDSILDSDCNKVVRNQYEAELAYLRGDYTEALNCYHLACEDPAAKLRMCTVAISVVISTGGYALFAEIEDYLKNIIKTGESTAIRTYAEQSLAIAFVSTLASSLIPTWLRQGDFSTVLPHALPDALHKRSKYYQCIEEFEAMSATAQTALSIYASRGEISMSEVYLRVNLAIASAALGRISETKAHLLEALHICLPHGFITPFAEAAASFGGILEECLLEEFPEYYERAIDQWNGVFRNWIDFHNRFTKDNLTQILTLREYHIAQQVARHTPYAEIAQRYAISVGRLKNIVQGIYRKLLISNRRELREYIIWQGSK